MSLYNPENVAGMARFGIDPENTYGVSISILRAMAKKIEHNHNPALKLWNLEIHEARIFASLVNNQKKVTEEQMELWVKDFDSWYVCDQCITNLFGKTPFATRKPSNRVPERKKS